MKRAKVLRVRERVRKIAMVYLFVVYGRVLILWISVDIWRGLRGIVWRRG